MKYQEETTKRVPFRWRQHFGWLIVVSIAGSLVPFTNDIYLAAMPSMSHFFHTNSIQYILSVYLIGTGFAQLFYGVASDRFGRMPVTKVGLTIYLIGTLITCFTNSFPLFLIARFLQAIGVCSVIVNIFAMTRDMFIPEDITKVVGILMAIISISPCVAPIFGGFIFHYFGWRPEFYFLFAQGTLVLSLIIIKLKETLPPSKRLTTPMRKSFGVYLALVKEKRFMIFVLFAALAYSAMFSYLGDAPMMLMNGFHVSAVTFSYLLGFNAFAIVVTSYISPWILSKVQTRIFIAAAGGIVLLGALSLFLVNLFMPHHLLGIVLPVFIYFIGTGLLRPTSRGLALKSAPAKYAGSASAVISCFVFGLGGFFSIIMRPLSMLPVQFSLVIMLIASFIIFSALYLLPKGRL